LIQRIEHEAILLICSALQPENILRVKDGHISRPNYVNLLKEIKRKGRDALDFLNNLNVQETELIEKQIDKITFMPSDEIEYLFKYSLRVIEKDETIKVNLSKLDRAKDLLINGYLNEGVELAKGVKFYTDKEFKSTIDYMKESIRESNGILTGIPDIDNRLNGLLLGNMFAIAGDSGQMKTMFSLWVIITILIKNPKLSAAYFEKEMLVKDVARRLVSMYLRIDMGKIQGLASIENEAERKKAEKDIESKIDEELTKDNIYTDALKRLHIVAPNQFNDAFDIWKIVESLQVQIWGLDFITMLGDGEEGDEGYQFVKRQLGILKDMTTTTETLGFPLSQLKQNTVDTRTVKIPKLSDMEYGSKLKQYSAYVFSVFYPYNYYRSWDKNWFYAISAKARHNHSLTLPLKVFPEYCYYQTPLEDERIAMLGRLQNYITQEKD
jgi:hypothetical protein